MRPPGITLGVGNVHFAHPSHQVPRGRHQDRGVVTESVVGFVVGRGLFIERRLNENPVGSGDFSREGERGAIADIFSVRGGWRRSGGVAGVPVQGQFGKKDDAGAGNCGARDGVGQNSAKLLAVGPPAMLEQSDP